MKKHKQIYIFNEIQEMHEVEVEVWYPFTPEISNKFMNLLYEGVGHQIRDRLMWRCREYLMDENNHEEA